MNLCSYDIELYDDLDAENPDLSKIRPSVAAICTNENDVEFFYDDPLMAKETAKKLVLAMMDKYQAGFIPFGWNTCSFDFCLLGHYSGMPEECGELALNGIDAMLMVTFNKGYFLGLDAALVGAGLETKLHSVKLKDGSVLEQMSGKLAPDLWRRGEYQAVMDYLKMDVIQPLKLASVIETKRGIGWTSKTGKNMFCSQPITPVKMLFSIPVPNTSWMAVPMKPRVDFVSWIPLNVLRKNGLENVVLDQDYDQDFTYSE